MGSVFLYGTTPRTVVLNLRELDTRGGKKRFYFAN